MMNKRVKISMQTRMNWLIDAAVLIGGVLAALTGIYFLYLPSGGYQGGRNLMYGVTIFFERHTWSDLHVWGGILMIAAILIHFAIQKGALGYIPTEYGCITTYYRSRF